MTLHDIWHAVTHLGTTFQLTVLALVTMVILVFIALPTFMGIVSAHEYISLRNAQGNDRRWLWDVNRWVGRPVAWLVVFLMLVQVTVIGLRHVFDLGSVQLQESAWYLHGTVLMLGAGYTFAQNKHVRLDILYRRLSLPGQHRINLVGHALLLIPLCLTILWVCAPYIASSFAVREVSSAVGGLPLLFVMKSLIAVFALLILLFGVQHSITLLRSLLGARSKDPRHAHDNEV